MGGKRIWRTLPFTCPPYPMACDFKIGSKTHMSGENGSANDEKTQRGKKR